MAVSAAPVKLFALLACAWAFSAVPAGAASAIDTRINSTRFVTSDGVRLHVLEACPQGITAQDTPAPVIAFVPGWSMPAAIWREQLLTLGTTYCVAALDPRGQGESEIAGTGYTIERRAADVCEFIARYPRVVLVGWSLGALEALQCIHRHGHAALAALVLVDSSVGEEPVPAPDPGPTFRDKLRQDRDRTVADFMRGILGATRTDAEVEALTVAALRLPLDASLSLFPSAVPRTHWRNIARSFPKPLLYAVSRQFAAQAKNLQRQRPATQVEIFETAGHALFADEPARFNALLARFVAAAAAR
ncbi:MAG: alpha/beta hydrolase [Betaproteobacteria bacterium]|nr:MAG: alpha/beta hydrolase [Betaproteobacteria bacterium]